MNGYTTADLYTSSVPDNTTTMNSLNAPRQPMLHRQPSRQFDVYGQMPQAQNAYYDTARGFNGGLSGLNNNQNYELNGAQTWNPNSTGFGPNGLGTIGPMGGSGATTRLRPTRGRAELPSNWVGNDASVSNNFNHMDNGRMHPGLLQHRNGSAGSDLDDELIPTAIVIKNIPFAVRKEQLMGLMSDMHLPLPYAFNYHFDNGVFRGLAFANFTSPEETAAVIDAMNLYELQGRKLRVEYKKMLPLEQRERIEREKRQRRGQLEEQHRPIPNQLHSYPSMSSIGSHPPPSTSPHPQASGTQSRAPPSNVDMNDPMNLKWYTEMLEFRSSEREVQIFEAGLLPSQRRTIHTLAHQLGLHHMSTGEGERRQVHVFRNLPAHTSPTSGGVGQGHAASDMSRGRQLVRAATTEFGDNRHNNEAAYNNTLRGQASLNLLPGQDSFGNNANLRAAKSYADLRSYTPSPVYSTSSFSQGGAVTGLRLGQLDAANAQNREGPLLTPATSHQTLGSHRDDLASGFGGLSLGAGLGNSGSPRRLRSMFSWDQDNQQQQQTSVAGPIGGHRGTQPMRQPQIPSQGAGFGRSNGHRARGSDEYRSASGPEIIVE